MEILFGKMRFATVLRQIRGGGNMELISLRWIRLVRLLALFLVITGRIVSAGAAESTGTEAKTIVVLGDSLAAGYGLDPNEAYPAVLQKRIKEAGWNFTVVNAGLSGDTTAGGLRRVERRLKRRLGVLPLELGSNAWLRGIAVESMK